MEYVPCDLCGADDPEILWDKAERESAGLLRSVVVRDENGRILNGRTVVCRRCGLAYASPRMTREELDAFYRTEYRRVYPHQPDAEGRHAERAFGILQEVPVKQSDRFLDVGASQGRLVDKMLLRCDAWGLEPCVDGSHPRIIAGTLEEHEPEQPYHLVAMLNTLEHLPSPTEALQRLRGFLCERGLLLIAVPNLATRTIRLPPDAFLSNAHLFHFTPDTLDALLRKCGLRPVQAWNPVEEVGEKLYVLAEKAEPEERWPEPDIEGLRKHLARWEQIAVMKRAISDWGYR